MKIKFYKSENEYNKINKILENPTEKDIKIKQSSINLNQFEIIMKESYSDMIEFNYCEIPDIKKFYFIQDIKPLNNELISIYLTVDLLKTYSEQISEMKCLIVKSENPNVKDMDSIRTKEQEIIKYNFDSIFDKKIIAINVIEEKSSK